MVVGAVLVILALVLAGFAAVYALSRRTSSAGERGTTENRLAQAAAALEQFAASTGRLPCPAVPTSDDGVEVRNGDLTMCDASVAKGTLPWKTIGMKRDDSFDAWGRKISYRVYTGDGSGNGSMTRDQGASMVACDTVELMPAIPATRLCDANADLYLRNTTPALFLANKGLSVNDFGAARNDVAYALISHGPSGLGGFSVSGVRRELPQGDERSNTQAAATFVAKAASNPDTLATSNQHFDDAVLFRSVAEVVAKANQAARNWPDAGVAVFDLASVAAAAGIDSATLASTNSTGATQIDFGTFRVTGYSGATATNISFDESYGAGGLGVYGGAYFGQGGNLVLSSSNERLRIELNEPMSKFAITLNDFGMPTYSGIKFTERVRFDFWNGGVFLGTAIRQACREPDGILASFSIDVGTTFNRVDIRPLTASPTVYDAPTGLLLSEFIGCRASASSCLTSLAQSSRASICS